MFLATYLGALGFYSLQSYCHYYRKYRDTDSQAEIHLMHDVDQ